MKIFITGGAGFIGSNFINIFCKNNPSVEVINFEINLSQRSKSNLL